MMDVHPGPPSTINAHSPVGSIAYSLIEGKKEAIAEQLRLGEELRKRVDKADSVEASDSDDSAAPRGDSDDSDLEEGDEEGSARDQRKSQRLRSFANDVINGENLLDKSDSSWREDSLRAAQNE